MMTTTIDFLHQTKTYIDLYLEEHLPQENAPPSPLLHQAMRYSVLNGGKRFRSALVFAVADCFKTDWAEVAPIAGAIECLHAYSLVHDDLPAMDNDTLRRGKPTCHIAFNEATAILVGDGLQALAFEWLVEAPLAKEQRIAIIRCFSHAIGHQGMVGGQALDCLNASDHSTLTELETLHRLKTGALIEASLIMAALGCGVDDETSHQALRHYGKAIGLAFQIQDDILDFEEQDKTMGQPSYIKLIGLNEAKQQANDWIQRGSEALAALPEFELLRKLAFHVIERIC